MTVTKYSPDRTGLVQRIDPEIKVAATIYSRDRLPFSGTGVTIYGYGRDCARLCFRDAIMVRNFLNEYCNRQMRALYAKEGQAV